MRHAPSRGESRFSGTYRGDGIYFATRAPRPVAPWQRACRGDPEAVACGSAGPWTGRAAWSLTHRSSNWGSGLNKRIRTGVGCAKLWEWKLTDASLYLPSIERN